MKLKRIGAKMIDKFSDMTQELQDVLRDYDDNDTQVVFKRKPRGSTITLEGRKLIIVPELEFGGEDMLELTGKVNIKKVTGWSTGRGPLAWIGEKIELKKPAWLIYYCATDGCNYYVYEF